MVKLRNHACNRSFVRSKLFYPLVCCSEMSVARIIVMSDCSDRVNKLNNLTTHLTGSFRPCLVYFLPQLVHSCVELCRVVHRSVNFQTDWPLISMVNCPLDNKQKRLHFCMLFEDGKEFFQMHERTLNNSTVYPRASRQYV